MSTNDKSNEQLTRKDIHDATKNGTQDYSKLLNPVNAQLAEHKIPVPTQTFAKKVITNAQKVEDGDMHTSTAFLQEVPHLVKHGVTQVLIGAMKSAQAKADYNTGKVFRKKSEESDTGSTNTGLGILSLSGAVAATSAGLLAAGNQASKYKTGTYTSSSWQKSAVQTQQQQQQQQQQETQQQKPQGPK